MTSLISRPPKMPQEAANPSPDSMASCTSAVTAATYRGISGGSLALKAPPSGRKLKRRRPKVLILADRGTDQRRTKDAFRKTPAHCRQHHIPSGVPAYLP